MLVTDQQSKLGQPESAVKMDSELVSRPIHFPERRGRTSAETIQAGLEFLAGRWQNGHWQSPWAAGGSAAWLTACVLARLAEMSHQHISHSLQRKIESSLDWLLSRRSPENAWGENCCCAAWAVIALRGHGRTVPAEALDFLRRCRRPDGGFGPAPASANGVRQPSLPDVTAVAVHALDRLDWEAEDFLAAYLEGMGASKAAGSRVSAGLALRFEVCAEILDWREGLASPSLLNQVRQATAGFGNEGVLDRALLLRCLLRLRMQRAWPLAASLRAMQMEDGSWSERDDHKILATVTAVSALVLAESQPGLYFGSDLPLPRRLHQL